MKSTALIPLITAFFCIQSSPGAQEKVLNPVNSEELPIRIEAWVPVHPITQGPKYHWFGYYDKLQFDPSGRYVLGMEVDFEDRSPEPEDVIKIGMIDLRDNDRWIELGESRAWNWQQGCMLQWRPGSASEIVWNDRDGDRFVCHILDVFTGKKRTLPFPIYTLSPDGHTAVTVDFQRINDMRPGYGYAGIPDKNKDVLAPKDAGIYRANLETGELKLIISVADMLKIPYPKGDISDKKHYFNHLLFNKDGSRFIFLNRWRIGEYRASNPSTPFDTRMLTARPDGSDIRVVDDSGYTSHFIWRDTTHILAWTKLPSHGDRFYLFSDDGSKKGEAVGPDVMTVNGHCTYLPGGEWILNDTYPGADRLQHVYLYHIATGIRVPVANVFMHKKYQFDKEFRVDTHPRFSPDGMSVVIDSPHDGAGRQMYLLDISGIAGGKKLY
ncbi:hypothetical protein LLG96_14645 [bacterium]|nr:hypothetical protein [bacterium]